MGSITSRPKVPATASPTIITVPVATPVTTSAAAPSVAKEPARSDEQIQAEARSMGLLGRRRGRLSTILTGFRGVLNQSGDSGAQRKTLLGE